ncbi:MAG: flippase-like domain-containing protein [Chloroflexaceae bacterium]|nr:flippase-like domain-containing protein [Chloroflexaceae bacterium]
MQHWRRWLGPLRFFVSGGLLLYLVWHANPASIWAEWRTADLWLIGLAIVLQLLGVLLSTLRWQALLAGRGQAQPLPWLLAIYLAGQFANNFLPTSVGGDAVRLVQLGRRIGSYSQASASVFLDRLMGFLALSLIASLALVLSATDWLGPQIVTSPPLMLLTAGFAAVAVLVVLASFAAPRLLQLLGAGRLPQAAQRPLQNVATALADYAPQGWRFGQVLLLSFGFHLVWIGLHVAIGLALGLDVPLLIYALMVPITDIVGLAPIFVNNLGAREAIFSLYLGQVGVSVATALALSFMVFTVRLVVSALGGLVVLLGGADLRVQPPAAGPAGDASVAAPGDANMR